MVNKFKPVPTGSKHERGILAWNEAYEGDFSNTLESGEVYNLPFGISAYFSSFPWLWHIPFCPPGMTASLEETEADTNSLENKQSLGHLEPSQVIIGATLWVVYSCQHMVFFGLAKQIHSEAAQFRVFQRHCTVTIWCKEFHINIWSENCIQYGDILKSINITDVSSWKYVCTVTLVNENNAIFVWKTTFSAVLSVSPAMGNYLICIVFTHAITLMYRFMCAQALNCYDLQHFIISTQVSAHHLFVSGCKYNKIFPQCANEETLSHWILISDFLK